MKRIPVISVIVPVYNVEAYVGKCLDSILDQTYKNLEILLIDDGSTDTSGKICDKYREKDNRIQCIHQKNMGLGFTRNMGLDLAKGEYIVFVDSDDCIKPTYVEDLYQALIRNAADLSICAVSYDEKYKVIPGKTFEKEKVLNREELFISYLREAYILTPVWNKMYKASLFDGVRFSSLRAREDLDFLYRILGKVEKAVYIPRHLYVQFIRPGSLEQSLFNEEKLKMIHTYEKMAQYIQKNIPDISEYARLLKAQAIGFVMEEILLDPKSQSYVDLYESLKKDLRMELDKNKEHDAINDQLYDRLESILVEEDVFLKNIKKRKIKRRIKEIIKSFL